MHMAFLLFRKATTTHAQVQICAFATLPAFVEAAIKFLRAFGGACS